MDRGVDGPVPSAPKTTETLKELFSMVWGWVGLDVLFFIYVWVPIWIFNRAFSGLSDSCSHWLEKVQYQFISMGRNLFNDSWYPIMPPIHSSSFWVWIFRQPQRDMCVNTYHACCTMSWTWKCSKIRCLFLKEFLKDSVEKMIHNFFCQRSQFLNHTLIYIKNIYCFFFCKPAKDIVNYLLVSEDQVIRDMDVDSFVSIKDTM